MVVEIIEIDARYSDLRTPYRRFERVARRDRVRHDLKKEEIRDAPASRADRVANVRRAARVLPGQEHDRAILKIVIGILAHVVLEERAVDRAGDLAGIDPRIDRRPNDRTIVDRIVKRSWPRRFGRARGHIDFGNSRVRDNVGSPALRRVIRPISLLAH